MAHSHPVSTNHFDRRRLTQPSIFQDWRDLDDELEAYCLMRKHTRLVTDGSEFFEVLPSPVYLVPYLDSSLDVEMDLASTPPVAPAPPHTLPMFATPTSTTPAVALTTPSSGPPPPSTHITGIGVPQPAMSQKEARALILAYILASTWFESHAKEPSVDETGVPQCAQLLAKPKDSIWACFFRRVRRNGVTILKCVGCGHETTRLTRAVGHQRAKWEHKPFVCTDVGW